MSQEKEEEDSDKLECTTIRQTNERASQPAK